MDFPQYRKRFDEKSFYKITSSTTFEEVQLVGKRFFLHVVHADKYFEKLQIQSMLNLDSEMYKDSEKEEFMRFYRQAENYLLEKQSKNEK